MPVVLLEKDPFIDAVLDFEANTLGEAQHNVRRPLYGMKVKEARFAFISVYQAGADGTLKPISLTDSSAPGGTSNANHNFILQSVSEQRQEKVQIIETFGDHYSFFYGEKPTVLTVQGMLFNTVDFNWKNEWLQNYENLLRGTRCVENRARVFLGFDDVLVEGYILGTTVQYDKDLPNLCPFGFQLLVTKQIDMSLGNSSYVQATKDARTIGSVGTLESLESTQGLDEGDAPTLTFEQQEQLQTEQLAAEGGDPDAVSSSLGGVLVEYPSPPSVDGKWVIDPTTGESTRESGASGAVPESIGDYGQNTKTAFWVTDPQALDNQFLGVSDSLGTAQKQLAAKSAGVDLVTAGIAIRANPTAFPLSDRSVVSPLSASLDRGVSNQALVIDDFPVLG